MIGDTIPVTYNAVVKTLVKINQDGYGSEYYLDDSANFMRFTLTVKHTIPAKGSWPESHVMKLAVEFLDSVSLKPTRIASSWGVLRSDEAIQDFTSSQRVQAAFLTAFTAANTNKMLGRES